MLRRSEECVINLPTIDLVDTVVGVGNCMVPTSTSSSSLADPEAGDQGGGAADRGVLRQFRMPST
jgi:hypothetical protein